MIDWTLAALLTILLWLVIELFSWLLCNETRSMLPILPRVLIAKSPSRYLRVSMRDIPDSISGVCMVCLTYGMPKVRCAIMSGLGGGGGYARNG